MNTVLETKKPNEGHRIALVDDDPLFADSLAAMVDRVYARHSAARTLDRYNCPTRLLEALQEGREYDLLFLDIVMGNLDGVSLAKKIRAMGIQSFIVFVTSTREYALEGYRVQALQYLLKPVQEKDLELLYTSVEAQAKRRRGRGCLVVRGKNEIRSLTYEEIEYIEQVGRKAVVHTSSNELASSVTLRELYDTLPKGVFLRCHQGYVVNLQHVAVLNATQLELGSGVCLPVSRSHAKEVKAAFIERHFEGGA